MVGRRIRYRNLHLALHNNARKNDKADNRKPGNNRVAGQRHGNHVPRICGLNCPALEMRIEFKSPRIRGTNFGKVGGSWNDLSGLQQSWLRGFGERSFFTNWNASRQRRSRPKSRSANFWAGRWNGRRATSRRITYSTRSAALVQLVKRVNKALSNDLARRAACRGIAFRIVTALAGPSSALPCVTWTVALSVRRPASNFAPLGLVSLPAN
jgi:hypothetical protein